MAGIKDIAKITGLSLATISRVLNDSPLVSPKTKKKVLDAARSLDYRPNMMAAALRSGKSNIVGVIVPEINNSFFSSIINGIERELSAVGYNIIIIQSHESQEKESAAIESFIQLKTDGILMSLSKNTKEFSFIRKLSELSIPLVFFDRGPSLEDATTVVLNDYKGAFLATQHLIDNGCTKVFHIAGNLNVPIFQERKKGFLDALKKNDLQVTKEHIIQLSYDTDKDEKLLQDYLDACPRTDGFFAHGDDSCLYTINLLKRLGKAIPEEIKAVGFGNTDFCVHVDPQISTIDQKCDIMGTTAVSLLLQQFDKERPLPSKEILSPELIVRKSSK
ncbi:LacI family DNA-binding transcriptional regulator [Spongiimicrobium salis]|uniref:LacI family DNA-binding transcriptional regulator n=1 Tax=Spongiimicrobium salis TaxID=1667022 RepID=UPI00374DCF13